MTQPKLLNIWSDVPTWLEAIISEAHGARGRFKEERRALLGPYRDLSEQDRSDLRDFLEHGADRADVASRRVADLRSLIDRGYLTTLGSSSGEFVFLTTRGRSALGAHQGDFTLSAAAGHVARRRVRESLEAQGWRYIQKEGPSLISLRSPEGKKYYLLCGHGKYGSVVVARRLSTLKGRLREENAVLMVVSGEPEKLMGMRAVKEGWVEVFGLSFENDKPMLVAHRLASPKHSSP